MMPSTRGPTRKLFHDDKQRGKAVTVWTAVMTTGISLVACDQRSAAGALLVGAVFLINLPSTVLLLLLVSFLVPEFKSAKRERFDLLSAVLSLGAVLLVIYGIKEWARHGYEPLPVLATSAGFVLGFGFVRRQKHLAHPMIDLGLLGRRTFGGPVFANLLAL